MNPDPVILAGLALGHLAFLLVGAIVAARMLQAFGIWTDRNAR